MQPTTTDVTVNLVFEEQSFHKRVSSFDALAIYATVAAEPESFSDVEIALERYCSAERAGEICQEWRTGINEPPSGPALVLDFTARVAALRKMPFHYEVSQLFYDEDPKLPCCFSWPNNWFIADTYDEWSAEAEKTRPHQQATRRLETRKVLYNEFVVYALNSSLASEDFDVVATHKDWLTTPRADLLNKSPRDCLLANYQHIERDLNTQADIWTSRREQPPGLDVDSIAYRYALFGPHEFIQYYEMCRVILDSLSLISPAERNRLTVDILLELRDEWLNSARDSISPANIIHRERKRIPLTDDEPIDDCFISKMMHSNGIAFWHFDSCHMDKDFEFTPCKDLDEWEFDYEESFLLDQEDKKEFARREKKRRRAEKRRRSDNDNSPGWNENNIANDEPSEPPISIDDRGNDYVWKNSTFNREVIRKLPTHQIADVLMHGIIFCFAELMQDMTEVDELSKGRQQLQNDAEKLNDAVRGRSLWTVKSLVASLQSDLSNIRHIADNLQPKCDDLHGLLSELLAGLVALEPEDHENEGKELQA